MPELPEIETIRRGVVRHILDKTIHRVIVRERRLRWPVPRNLNTLLRGQSFRAVARRGKYLLFHTDKGCMVVHLGMSGSLHINSQGVQPNSHDHIDFIFASGRCMRFRDPRKFGSIHWSAIDPNRHRLLEKLGPEPLSSQFNAGYLFRVTRGRAQAIKTFIMNQHIVAGVGNIYANESLFLAGINPECRAGQISRKKCADLSGAIKRILRLAIKAGGTTLKDFSDHQGRPGYFRQQLKVYNRAGCECLRCGSVIEGYRLGQRAAYCCPTCQDYI